MTLSETTRAAVYQHATDAHFEDLPAQYPCDCTLGRTYQVTVVIDGKAYATTTHGLNDMPEELSMLFMTLEQIAEGRQS